MKDDIFIKRYLLSPVWYKISCQQPYTTYDGVRMTFLLKDIYHLLCDIKFHANNFAKSLLFSSILVQERDSNQDEKEGSF